MGIVSFLGSTPQCSRQIYAINAHITENIEKGYKSSNIYILTDSQVGIKAFNNFQINSKLVWDCHQSLMKHAEHNRVQLVWKDGNWWKWNSWSSGYRKLLTSTHRTWACTWNICKVWQARNQGLYKHETWEALAVHMWTNTGSLP